MTVLKTLTKTLVAGAAALGLMIATPAFADPFTPQEIYEAYLDEQNAYAAYMDAYDLYMTESAIDEYSYWQALDWACTYTYMMNGNYNVFDWHDCQDAALAWLQNHPYYVQELYDAYTAANWHWADMYDIWYYRYTHPA